MSEIQSSHIRYDSITNIESLPFDLCLIILMISCLNKQTSQVLNDINLEK